MLMDEQVHVIDHPLIGRDLAVARDAGTPPPQFREVVGRIGMLLAYEATRDFSVEAVDVATPLTRCRGVRLRRPVTVVPVLRAGLGFAEAIHRLIPDAVMGHLGMFRDEKKLKPVGYYQSLPPTLAAGPVLLVDPMLATGGSAIAGVKLLRQEGAEDIRLLCLIAAPEGVAALRASCGDVPVYTAAVDEKLNEQGYILPGLGDAGDRLFGTLGG